MNIGLGIGIPFTRSSLWASIFTPSALFLDGSTQGVWYDPSDINLTWRRNLLTYTEQFDNAAWGKNGATVTPNTDVAPDGTTTADTVTFSGSNFAIAANSNTSVFSRVVTGSVYITGTAGETIQIAAGGLDQLVTLTGAWQRFVVTKTAFTDTINVFNINTYGGATARTIKVWGAQLEQGSTATPYQRITDGIQDYLQYQPLPVMYRDAAGTQPVTAVEQPVGLMLDKSKGLVLGSELVSNGGFDTDVSGWTRDISWVASGIARVTTSTISGPYQTLTTVVGRRYNVTARLLTSTTQARVRINIDNGLITTVAETADVSSGVLTLSFVATSTTSTVYLRNAAAGITDWDNISVRELPGNHAFNPSGNSANFPVLSARYNLLTKTEDFSDAVWTKQGSPVITPDTTVAPDGSLTADTLAISPSNYVYQSINITAGVTYTLSCWVKVASGVNQFKLNTFGSGNNFTSDVKTATTNWQQFSFTFTSIASGATSLYAPIVDGLTGGNFYIWGADLRVANDALNQPAYQRVNTSTDYDTVGFKPYVRFNGVNQWLQTNSIDFSYSDKMFVCAGVRKLSDAAIGILSELSAITDNNNGAFFLLAPSLDATASYRSRSKGTASVDLQIISGYPAPITNVFSFTGNISAPSTTIRVNGIQAATSTADQGTGNYGNYPLYIGARAGTSLFFNGRLYQLVIAAGSEIRVAEEDSDLFLSESGDFITAETTVAVIQSAIEQTEAFVNRKTSAF